MKDLIQLLPDSVANQIAAGEVIQRPASVIKELVENAIDAGATSIQVVILDAGRTLIQVIDNGSGMSETDARLAFERHATSKIRQADDLFSLHTMGFRGEALPSIAAVAQVELLTRTADSELGTRLRIAATRVVSQEPASCPVGSNFRVENLFYNVPARRKFLKSNATELSNILTAFERIALVYPHIAFTLHSNGQEIVNLRAEGSFLPRISSLFGHKLSQELLPLTVDTSLCHISGFVGKPEAARKKAAHEYFFVNGRFMRHAYFHRAVVDAYERLVPEASRVPYFIYIDVPPADIDVNIHPTKTEIKFENEQAIWQILSAAVKDALGRFSDIPAIDFDTEGRPDFPVFDPHQSSIEIPKVSYNPSYNPFKEATKAPSHPPRGGELITQEPHSSRNSQPSQHPLPSLWEETGVCSPPLGGDGGGLSGLSGVSSPSLGGDGGGLSGLSFYQYKARYIMTAVKSGLMIVDQHRADLRIRYEQNLEQLSRQTASTQRLLFPETITLPPSQQPMMQELLPTLGRAGFDLTDLGGGSYALAGVPAGLDGLDPATLVTTILTDHTEAMLPSAASVSPQESRMALALARAAAIPYGLVLQNDEMETIINRLFACQNVNYTPDGHPILCILPQSDIEELMG